MLEPLTIAMMLGAGLLHATWHALVKSGSDQPIVLAGMGLVAGAAAVCVVPFLPFPAPDVWLVIACSVLLHVGYKIGLARAYALGDLGQAYPLGRGMVPMFSTAIALLLLGQVPPAQQLLGISVVSAGLIWLAVHSLRRDTDPRLFAATALVGTAVAGYTALDAYGARLSGDWASFTAWLVLADSVSFGLLTYLMRGQALWNEIRPLRWRILASGVLGLGSFSIFLWALSRSPVGAISALREASILFTVLIGMFFYGEPRSLSRIGAVVTIAIGLIAIAASR